MPTYDYLKNIAQYLVGDEADPDDTKGIQPTNSPIDYAVGGLPSLAKGIGRGLAEGAANQATEAINAQNMAKAKALGKYLNPEIQAFKEAPSGMAELPAATQQKLYSLGKNPPKVVPKVDTMQGLIEHETPTSPVDLNAYRENAPTKPMGTPPPSVGSEEPTDNSLAKLAALIKKVKAGQ